jgi:O-antigen/teichoic acid export membrane protein
MSSVLTSIVYFIVAVATVPALGLHGLAFAQVLQSLLILLINWWKLRRLLPELSIVPRIWKRALFGEMVRYGANFQAEAIFGMLHDPIAKALLSKYGGLATVGYYEMASRMVFQLRSLIGSAFMVLVPVIASAHENTPARVRQLYATSCRALIYVTVPAYGAVIAAAPVISQLWIGRVEPTFVLCTVLLAVGWMVNALNAPAMHANLGIGELWWNTAAAVAIAAFNVMLGIPLGHLFAGPGVVVSWALALAMGSTLIGVAYHRRHRIPLTDWFHPESRAILLAAAVGAGLAVLTYTAAGDSGHAIGGAVAGPVIYALIVSVPLWTHPVRRLLMTVVLQQRQAAHRG